MGSALVGGVDGGKGMSTVGVDEGFCCAEVDVCGFVAAEEVAVGALSDRVGA